MECMLGLMKQNVFLLLFAPTKGAHLLIATLGGYKGGTNAVTEIEIYNYRILGGIPSGNYEYRSSSSSSSPPSAAAPAAPPPALSGKPVIKSQYNSEDPRTTCGNKIDPIYKQAKSVLQHV